MPNPGSQQAVDEATELGEIGFPEFTAKLVNDTFDAMVSSMVRQEQSYADLLEKVAMDLEEFASKTVPEHQVQTWLDSHLGTKNGKNPVEQGKLSKDDVETIATALEKSHSKKFVANNLPGVKEDSGSLSYSELDSISDDQKNNIKKCVRLVIAKPRMEALEELVEKGVVRVVVDDGTIHTDLDFHTSGSDTHSQRSSSSEKNATSASLEGGFVGEMFGISGSASTKNVYVSTRHSQQTAEASANVDIQGHVKVNFRGDYEPLQNPNKSGSNSSDTS